MSQNPYLPRFKDQADSVAVERRRPPPNQDPDGTLLAAEDGTLLKAKSYQVSTARQAKTVESPHKNNVRAPPSAAEATATLMAFDVVAVEDSTADNSNNYNDIVLNINTSRNKPAAPSQGSHDSITGSSNNDNDIVPNINNKSNEPAAPSQSNHDHHQKSFPWKTAIVAVVVIVIAVVVVLVVLGVSAEDNGNNPSPNSTRSQDITNFVNSKSYMGVDLSPTGASPEERALQWLINYDPLQLNVGAQVGEFRLLQRYSLLTFWFQAGTGTTWDNSTNWLNADECTWAGITCQSGVAIDVSFRSNGLQGSLSPDLGLLTDLTVLHFHFDTLFGSLPSEIGLWTNLENFSMISTALKGSLPSETGLWKNLLQFSVSDNALTGSLPSEIGLWTNLEQFSVQDNDLTGTIPATIANWRLIVSAMFSGNRFSGSMPDGICQFIARPHRYEEPCRNGTATCMYMSFGDILTADCDLPCSCCTNSCD